MGKFGSDSLDLMLVDGYDLIPAKLQGFAHKVEAVQEPSHGAGDGWEEHTPTGMKRATLTQQNAFFDDSANSIHVAFRDSQGTSRVVCFGVEGNTIGKHFFGLSGAFGMGYEPVTSLGGLTKANVEYRVSGQRDEGVILQKLEAKAADWDTKGADSVDYTVDTAQRVIPITSNSQANPTVVTTTVAHGYTTGDIVLIAGNSGSSPAINGQRTVTVISTTSFSVPVDTSAGTGGTGGTVVRANSANGGVGYLQVTAFSGFSGFVGKIVDSPDDVTYADLITFTNVTSAPAKERQTVSGTVDRHLAFDGNVTGSGSITVFCGFSRG